MHMMARFMCDIIADGFVPCFCGIGDSPCCSRHQHSIRLCWIWIENLHSSCCPIIPSTNISWEIRHNGNFRNRILFQAIEKQRIVQSMEDGINILWRYNARIKRRQSLPEKVSMVRPAFRCTKWGMRLEICSGSTMMRIMFSTIKGFIEPKNCQNIRDKEV